MSISQNDHCPRSINVSLADILLREGEKQATFETLSYFIPPFREMVNT